MCITRGVGILFVCYGVPTLCAHTVYVCTCMSLNIKIKVRVRRAYRNTYSN